MPQHARLAVDVGERAADQRQRRKRQHIAVEHPLHRRKIGIEKRAQPGQRHRERRTIDEGHRRGQYTGREHHSFPGNRDLAALRAWARFRLDETTATRFDKRLRHEDEPVRSY